MKKINNLILVLIIIILTYCHNGQSKTGNMNMVKKIEIKSVDFSRMTFLSVECNKFEEYFKDYRVLSITDTLSIKMILSQFENLEQTDSTYSKSIDTRAKVELFSNSDTSIICIGNMSLYMNDKHYKTPQGLIDFIEKLKEDQKW
jgi:hypothetical protein